VREFSAAPNYSVADTGSLTDDVVDNASQHPDVVSLRRHSATASH
jgi:hypothetical protein